MKVLILVCFVVTVAASASFRETAVNEDLEHPLGFNYHEKYGIPAAARLKAAEEAIDFDGSRIAGGNLGLTGIVPHMGGVAVVLQNGFISICGSSLVSNTKLVTAAACWWDGVNRGVFLTVVLGSVMIYAGGTRIATNEVVMHPSWDPRSSVHNNIAVITIRHVDYNNLIQPVALPSGAQLNNDFAGSIARAAGYGMIADVDPGLGTNNYLYFIDVEVLSNAVCSQYYSNIEDTTLCTSGAEGKSICRGDFGGPLALNNNGQDILIGVASFISQFGCTVGRPAGFTRVGPYVDWIRSQL